MKNLTKVFAIFLLLVAAFLISCDKEVETSSLTVNNFPKATIQGFVYADLDLTNYGDEPVPQGTKVIVTMEYSELGLGTGSLIDTVMCDNQGSFTCQVPADADGVDVTAKVVEFIYNQVQEFNFEYTTVLKSYPSGTIDFTVKSNDFQVENLTLGDPTAIVEPVIWETISGVMYASIDESNVGTEVVSGQQMTFNCTGWSTTVTTDANGRYQVDVPADENISVDFYFTIAGKDGAGDAITWRFDGNPSFGNFSDNDDAYDFTIDDTYKEEVTK
jgi:hypothetical protein